MWILCFLCSLCCFPLQLPSVLWYCWLGLLTCKNRLPYNLYCAGGDVKHCTIQSSFEPCLELFLCMSVCLSVGGHNGCESDIQRRWNAYSWTRRRDRWLILTVYLLLIPYSFDYFIHTSKACLFSSCCPHVTLCKVCNCYSDSGCSLSVFLSLTLWCAVKMANIKTLWLPGSPHHPSFYCTMFCRSQNSSWNKGGVDNVTWFLCDSMAFLFLLLLAVVVFSFVSVDLLIGGEGWVFCTSQEVSRERVRSDL